MVDHFEIFISSNKNIDLVRTHTRLDFSELFESLGADDELLWLDTAFPGNAEFGARIRPALERGARTKLLIMNPLRWNASFCADGRRAEDPSPKDVDALVKQVSLIRCVLRRCGLKEDCCQILACDELPSLPVCIVTHKGFPVRGYSRCFLSRPNPSNSEWAPLNGAALEHMHECFKQKWEKNLQQTMQSFSTLLERASPSRAVHQLCERGERLYAG